MAVRRMAGGLPQLQRERDHWPGRIDDVAEFNRGQSCQFRDIHCPSIESKIVTFADKTQHQLFLEPEGETTQEYYLNGFSSSLPLDVQLNALKTIPAFRNVRIYRPGYAIEYDFFKIIEKDRALIDLHAKRPAQLFPVYDHLSVLQALTRVCRLPDDRQKLAPVSSRHRQGVPCARVER